MKQEYAARFFRFAGCAALLGLLVISSSAATKPVQTAAAPVMVQVMPAQALAGASLEKTKAELSAQREQAIALLQSVIDDPRAHEEQIMQALEEKTRLAARMETEASVCALLAHMGFGDTAVVMGEGALSIIAPWQTAESEYNRVRMIDAAASQSGLSAGAIKIILAKK